MQGLCGAQVVLGEIDGRRVIGFCVVVGQHEGPHSPLESFESAQERMLHEALRPAA